MPSTDVSPQVVEDAVYEAIEQLGPERKDIRREATFEELDLDSLDLVEIAQVVEEKWGVEFDPQDFGDVKTVGEAIDLVLAKMS
jgi:acyl carrier protein